MSNVLQKHKFLKALTLWSSYYTWSQHGLLYAFWKKVTICCSYTSKNLVSDCPRLPRLLLYPKPEVMLLLGIPVAWEQSQSCWSQHLKPSIRAALSPSHPSAWHHVGAGHGFIFPRCNPGFTFVPHKEHTLKKTNCFTIKMFVSLPLKECKTCTLLLYTQWLSSAESHHEIFSILLFPFFRRRVDRDNYFLLFLFSSINKMF